MMNVEEIIKRVNNNGVLPVIAISEEDHAVPLAQACMETGLDAIEITFRTACASEAMRNIKKAYPEILLGAGTVLKPEQVNEAISCGADFVVTPGFNPDVVKYAIEKNIPIVPGVSCASEVEQAMGLGLSTVKFFPAEQSGGVAMLKALSGPYKAIKFIPTGGMTFDNFTSYLAQPNVVAIGGSFLINKKNIEDKNVEGIKADIRPVIDKLIGIRLHHIGMNCGNQEKALQIANTLQAFFNLPFVDGNSSIFCGNKEFELMKKQGKGTNGHIALGVNDIDRAKHFLEKRGVKFDEESLVIKDGKKIAIYLEEEISGYAFHLIKI